MRAIIVDDDLENIRQLKDLLAKHCRQVEIVGEATDAEQGAGLILTLKPDLVFLDIQMPDESGFDMLSSLGVQDFDVIFVTGYDAYAIQAIRCSALDYLLKPIDIPELIAAVQKAERKIKNNSLGMRIDNLIEIIKYPDRQTHKIALPIAKGHRLINPYKIIYLKASNNYTTFFMEDSQEILISKGLYHFEEVLNRFGFVRCHVSYIVNTQFVRKFHKEVTGYELSLVNGTDVPVSTMYLTTVKQALGLFKSISQ